MVFCVWEDARVWAHWNHFFYVHLRFDFSHRQFLVHYGEGQQINGWQRASTVLPGLRNSHLEGWYPWWLWHPCLLIWKEIHHFTSPCYSFTHSSIHSVSHSLFIFYHCFGNLLKQRAWWCCKPKNWAHFFVGVKIKDTTKSKIRRRKGLFLAASKENSRELSQSSVSLNSKIGVHGVHFKLRVHAYT